MKIKVTAREAKDNGDWDKFCKIVGMDVYAFKNGQTTDDEEFELTLAQAKACGLLPKEEEPTYYYDH